MINREILEKERSCGTLAVQKAGRKVRPAKRRLSGTALRRDKHGGGHEDNGTPEEKTKRSIYFPGPGAAAPAGSDPRINKKADRLRNRLFGGGWWIRTTEGIASRFTVCPLWPLGKSPIYI